jgi:predicted alpha/beta superfamily hydrolase
VITAMRPSSQPRNSLRPVACLLALATAACAPAPAAPVAPTQPHAPTGAMPLVLGETFQLDSAVLGQRRVVNVYLPPGYHDGSDRYPVLYMPDGGVKEDFQHVMGIVDVSIKNEVIRPMLIVGVENIERRHDLTTPTAVEEDRKAAPHAGGADQFRTFLRTELKPYVGTHYRVTAESAFIGESLAGLFVLDTLLLEPALFDSYISVDPSLYWNDQAIVRSAPGRLAAWSAGPKRLYLATADWKETQDSAQVLLAAMETARPAGLTWQYLPLPDEHHNTIYPVAALRALRALFPAPAKP